MSNEKIFTVLALDKICIEFELKNYLNLALQDRLGSELDKDQREFIKSICEVLQEKYQSMLIEELNDKSTFYPIKQEQKPLLTDIETMRKNLDLLDK